MHECALCSIRCWLAARTFRCLNLFSAGFSVSAPLSWHGRAQGRVEDDLESLKAFGAFILQGSLWYFALIGLCSVFLLIFSFRNVAAKSKNLSFSFLWFTQKGWLLTSFLATFSLPNDIWSQANSKLYIFRDVTWMFLWPKTGNLQIEFIWSRWSPFFYECAQAFFAVAFRSIYWTTYWMTKVGAIHDKINHTTLQLYPPIFMNAILLNWTYSAYSIEHYRVGLSFLFGHVPPLQVRSL